jgi:mono/diheme cytochrome c family protein
MIDRCVSLLILCLFAGLLQSAKTPAKPLVKPVSASTQPLSDATLVSLGQKVYQSQCTFCHQAKPVSVLSDLKAWTKLLYTSACPEVSVQLTNLQRKQMLAYFSQTFAAKPTGDDK